jgi:hypothetical protein
MVSFLGLDRHSIALIVISITIVYCLYACITFYRARTHRYRNFDTARQVARNEHADCEEERIESVAEVDTTEGEEGTEDEKEHDKQIGLDERVFTEKDKQDIQNEVLRQQRLEFTNRFGKFMDNDLLQHLLHETFSDSDALERYENRHMGIRMESASYGKRSDSMEECSDSVDSGSMGTKAIRVVREDGEPSAGDEEHEGWCEEDGW